MATSDSPQTGIYTQQIGPGRSATMVFDDGGTLDLTSGKVILPGALGIGYLQLGPHLFAAREMASAEKLTSGTTAPSYFFGGILLTDTTPALIALSTADPIACLQWASANVDSILLPPIALPNDMSTAGGFTIELYGETVGTGSASDAADAFTINTHWGVGGSTAGGTTHPNFSSTPSWQGITIASGTVTTNSLSIILTPLAHAARPINVYNMRASYTRKSS